MAEEVVAIEKEIEEQGNLVRRLKSEKAEKSKVCVH